MEKITKINNGDEIFEIEDANAIHEDGIGNSVVVKANDAPDVFVDETLSDRVVSVPRSLGDRASEIVNVRDFGAKGDGVNDDTVAIQAAIRMAVENGGGVVYFPFTGAPYMIKGGLHEVDPLGRPLRAQLRIPSGAKNIALVGEMPCQSLNFYQVEHQTSKHFSSTKNVVLRSTIDAPRVKYYERPYAVLAAPENTTYATFARGKWSVDNVVLKNLEIQVHMDEDKMYPTMSAVNFQNVSRLTVENCYFGLDKQIGWPAGVDNGPKELLRSPTNTVGLMSSGDQNDQQVYRNVYVQGFKFGFVFSEMIYADHLHASNCEYAVGFLDSTHSSLICHLTTHNNRRCICALPVGTATVSGESTVYPTPFGFTMAYPEFETNPNYEPQINLEVVQHDYECGHFSKPWISQMHLGISDPSNRIHGRITYNQGYPGDVNSAVLQEVREDIPGWNFASNHSYYCHKAKSQDEKDEENWAHQFENSGYFSGDTDPTYRKPCPYGYVAPNYGDYYPVDGGENMLLVPLKTLGGYSVPRNSTTSMAAILVPKSLAMKNGFAMCHTVDNGAMVLSGGKGFNADDGHGRITVFGNGHESYPRGVMLTNNSTSWIYLKPNEVEIAGAVSFTGAVNGSGVPKAMMPSSAAGKRVEITLGSDTIYPADGYLPKSGWFVMFIDSVTGENLSITAKVKDSSGTTLAAQSVSGNSNLAITLPCPKGSRISLLKSGTGELPSGYVCRLYYCEAEAPDETPAQSATS